MSNGINAPYGLQIVQSQIGNGGTQKLGQYFIYASYDGATTEDRSIFQGDMVKYFLNDKGKIGGMGFIVSGLVENQDEAASQLAALPVGIFIGCEYTDVSGRVISSKWWPASTQVKAGTKIVAYVNDDPQVVFKVQLSTSDNNMNPAAWESSYSCFHQYYCGLNALLGVGGVPFENPADAIPTNNPATGNTATGQSAFYLDGRTIDIANAKAGNPTLDIKIIGLVDPNKIGLTYSEEQDKSLNFVDVLCKFNAHIYGSTGTPGVFYSN